jgi:hypothetical protein
MDKVQTARNPECVHHRQKSLESESHWVRGFLSIVRNSNKLENITFRKLDLFPSSCEGKETSSALLDPLEWANLNHSRSNFRNVVLPRCLEYRAMDKVTQPRDYATPSEPFRFTFRTWLRHVYKLIISNSKSRTEVHMKQTRFRHVQNVSKWMQLDSICE